MWMMWKRYSIMIFHRMTNIMFIVSEEPDVPEEPDVRLLSSKAKKYIN